jgi:hypothetical protein
MSDHQRKGAVAFGEIANHYPTEADYVLGPDDKRSSGGGSKRYLELLGYMKELHIKKNAGYAGDNPDPWINFREAEGFGVSAFKGVLIRMSDKWIRIKSLIKNPTNDKVGESIKDTLFDLAAYALIAIAILEEKEND